MTVEEKRKEIQDYCDVMFEKFSCEECHHHCLIAEESDDCPFHPFDNNNHINTIYELFKEKVKAEPAVDMVNQPPHYKQGNMETIDEMILVFGKESVAHFCLCNAWKYRARALYKNKEQDMDKSCWYLDKYKELTHGE